MNRQNDFTDNIVLTNITIVVEKLCCVAISFFVVTASMFKYLNSKISFLNLAYNIIIIIYTYNMSVLIDGITYTVVTGFASVTASSSGITIANILSNVTINDINYIVTTIGVSAFNGRSTLTSVTIPNSVTTIGNSAFQGCSGLTSVTIPNSVTSIGLALFMNCSGLTSVNLPNKLTHITDHMFSYCTNLTSIIIPDGVTNINGYAFRNCTALASVNIPDSVLAIGLYTFHECRSLTSIIIPDNVSTIAAFTFRHCSNLTSVTINIRTIPQQLFEFCTSLQSVNMGNKTQTITGGAFKNCTSLPSITIPNGVVDIQHTVFQNCTSLASVTLQNTFNGSNLQIGPSCFQNCTSLTSITIPSSVRTIGDNAFKDCTSLTSIIIDNPANITSINTNSFPDVSSNTTSSIQFYNTASFSNLSAIWQTIAGYHYTTLEYTLMKPTILFSLSEGTLGGTSQITSFLSSGSSGSFSYSSSNTSVATISGNNITYVGVGTALITVTQEASGNYTSGIVNRSVVVGKVTPTISNIFIPTKVFGDNPFTITDPSSNSSGSFSYSSSNTSVATISGNTITIVGAGNSIITGIQSTTANYLSKTFTFPTFTVNKGTPIISNFFIPTKSARNPPFVITEPSSNSSGSFSYSSSNSSVATISGNTITIVGVGNSIITAIQSTTSNYLSKTATTNFEVNIGNNFYLPQLDVLIDASSALLYGADTAAFDGSANVSVNIPLVNAMNIFQFNTDSTDINNVVVDDIKYRVVYTGAGTTRIQFDLDTSALLITGDIHPDAANRNTTYDYVRYLAQHLFNTHLGVDLFSNETELRTTLRDDFSRAFDSNMSVLNAIGETIAYVNSPAKSILLQVINNLPERLSDIATLSLGSNWYKCPLQAGDVLYFRLTVNAAPNQNDLTGVGSIPPRVYLIQSTLV